MIRFLTTAVLDWFDDGCCDVQYLDIWNNTPITYTMGQATGPGWHTDQHDVFLTHDKDGRYFKRAADLLLRYRFYPPTILSSFGEFNLGDERRLRVGDRIVQRIHLARLFGRPCLDVIGLTAVSRVITEPRRQGFTYVTAAPHVEQGEWSAQVAWQENGDLILTIKAVSRPSPQEPARNHAFIRGFQKKAHRLGIAYFKQAVLS